MASFIGKILETIPTFFKCKDGTFSTHNGRNACSYHGGLADTAQETSSATIKVVGKWIGEARRRFEGLTNEHENELYDFLVTHKNYGTSKGQIKSELEFLQKVNGVIQKRTEFGVFAKDKPLNMTNLIQRSPIEQTYDSQLKELESGILKLQNYIRTKQEDLARRGATEAQILKTTEGEVATLARKRKQYAEMVQAKGQLMRQAGRERSLFDAVGRIGVMNQRAFLGSFI